MSAYTFPIQVAALYFAIGLIILFLPWLIYTYRKYGFLSLSKTIIVFSFLFYILSALFLVLLPLPETRNTCALQSPDTVFYNLRLFQFITDILYNTPITWSNPATWKYIIVQPSFFQAFFNFLLLLPLGVYVRYFFKERKHWWKAFAAGLAVTLFFEITQVTGIYGYFNCPYRIFDVDDLMLNSLGALLGFFIAPVILMLFPTHEEVVERTEKIEQQNIVKPLAVLLALIVDIALAQLLAKLIPINTMFSEYVTLAIFLVLMPLLLKGQTIGGKILRVQMLSQQSNPLKAYIRRYISILLYYMLMDVLAIITSIEVGMDSSWYVFSVFTTLIAALIGFSLYGAMFIHIIRVLLSKGKRKFYFDEIGKIDMTRKR